MLITKFKLNAKHANYFSITQLATNNILQENDILYIYINFFFKRLKAALNAPV